MTNIWAAWIICNVWSFLWGGVHIKTFTWKVKMAEKSKFMISESVKPTDRPWDEILMGVFTVHGETMTKMSNKCPCTSSVIGCEVTSQINGRSLSAGNQHIPRFRLPCIRCNSADLSVAIIVDINWESGSIKLVFGFFYSKISCTSGKTSRTSSSTSEVRPSCTTWNHTWRGIR